MPREKLFSITKKDLEIETFRAGGKGGQKQNKTETGVRIRHRASGAVGEARDSRSQARNRKAALERLVRSGKFRTFLSHKVHMLAIVWVCGNCGSYGIVVGCHVELVFPNRETYLFEETLT